MAIFTLKQYKFKNKIDSILKKHFTFLGIQQGINKDLYLYNCKLCNSTRVIK